MIRIIIRLPEGSRYYQVRIAQRICLLSCIYTLQRTIPSVRRSFTPSSPHRSNTGTGILTCLPSASPFKRIILRTRLTLIRLTLIRKPWSFGVQVSHLHYRYSCLHLLFQPLQQTSRFTFGATGMLPYPLE